MSNFCLVKSYAQKRISRYQKSASSQGEMQEYGVDSCTLGQLNSWFKKVKALELRRCGKYVLSRTVKHGES